MIGAVFSMLAGAMMTGGLLLAVVGLQRRPALRSGPGDLPACSGGLSRMPRWQRWTALAAAGAGLLVTVAGVPLVVAVLLPLAVLGLPVLLVTSDGGRRIARLDAISEWTRNLASVITAGQSLEQALTASVRSTPEALREPVTNLVARLRARWSTEAALMEFADELDDATGDLVVSALIIGSRHRGEGLSRVLTGLAESVAEEVRSRREIEAERDKARGSARLITLLAVGGCAVFAVAGDFLTPYQTPLGQIILAVLVGVFILGLVWLRRMVADEAPARFLPGREVTR
ncbi:MAG: type II secretion system F family protein [Micropruina sp.]|nr:MAG: type II secretion system F family protein [Micropruina sp.]